MNNYNQATFFINQSKVRIFHLQISTLCNRGDIDQDTKDFLIDLFQQKHHLSSDQYKTYAGLCD